ncbi:MAG: hypothetical protein WA906_00600 [Pacificimonas sp.]
MFTIEATLVVAIAALLGAGLTFAFASWCWRGWLSLKHAELGLGTGQDPHGEPAGNSMSRIEVADLKERVRKLEAIAAGVDL